LPGDVRGWVKSGAWGIQAPDPEREEQSRELMVEEAVLLTPAQRDIVEQTVRDHCRIRGWLLHAVVAADRDPETVRDQFKAWCSRKLSDQAGLTKVVAKKAGRRHWFTEGGDVEVIEDEEYLANAIRYVLEGQ
jgi:GAF domain-containing protein